jgi:hypothetical protein
MRVLAALAALIVAIGVGGNARADQQFAAGPLYGGGSEPGGIVTCRIYNFTTEIVDITLKQFTNNQNVTVNNFDFDDCPARLGSTRNCSFGLNIPGKLAYACRVFTAGTGKISGTLEIQKNQVVLTVVPLSPMK